MTSPVETTRPVEIQLAVLDSKLDGIRTTLDVRLNHIEERLTDNAAQIKAVERHADAAINAQGNAMAELLKAKTDKVQSEERYANIHGRVKAVESDLKKGVWIIVTAVIVAVLALVVVKPHVTLGGPGTPVPAVTVSQ